MSGQFQTDARSVAFCISCMALAGCGHVTPTLDPVLQGVTGEVAVSDRCLKGAPQEPAAYADDKLPLGPGLGGLRYKLTDAANEQREAFLALIRPWLKSCK